jgi:hypothetical protein
MCRNWLIWVQVSKSFGIPSVMHFGIDMAVSRAKYHILAAEARHARVTMGCTRWRW